MIDTNKYAIHAADWRQQLALNNRRTRIVIFLFILIYTCLGLLVDLYINLPAINLAPPGSDGLSYLVYQLATVKIFPYATVSMAVVAAISLFITYNYYDKIMLLGTDYTEITSENATDPQSRQLINVVEEMKVASGLTFMPKVYIINADYMNAFASGFSEKSAMVAITRGLLEKLDRNELAAVMAHELSHVRHHDIKLTLTASILSNLMLMVVDLLFYNALFSRRDRDSEDNKFIIVIIILRYVMPLLTILLMMYLSRTREFMADAGCVELMRDNEPLGRALLKIHEDTQANAAAYDQAYNATAHEDVRRAAYLYDPAQAGIDRPKTLNSLFSTHPDLEDRLAAIGFKLKDSSTM